MNDDLTDLSRELRDKINEQTLAETAHDDGWRWHLGASIIGQECLRQTWYDFRWFSSSTHPAHINRLFKRGHREEANIVGMLRSIGVAVNTPADNDGIWTNYKFSGANGHYGGTCDGVVALNTPFRLMLVEMKTHNTGSFSRLAHKGLIEAKPQHYAQMNAYGYGLQLDYGLYFAVNKNDDDIYLEINKLDYAHGKQLTLRAIEIVNATEPPPRISKKATDYRCKMCPHQDVCHYGVMPIKHCRSCTQSITTDNGEWYCNKWNAVIPRDVVRQGCDAYEGIKPT